MIFETNRLQVRKLKLSDLEQFHRMQSNPLVMRYTTGGVKNRQEHQEELKALIYKYQNSTNDFWIYAIDLKRDDTFIGTVALVKDGLDDEIGYRFLEEYWRKGYGFEVCEGLILYCRNIGLNKLTAYAVDKNIASRRILEKLDFKISKKQIAEDLKLPETKYELKL